MEQFDQLIEVASILNGPDGCPWDRKQTFFTLQPYVLEEAHELVEAVDGQKDEEIIEELGDLLYTILFYGTIAEKEGRFTLEDVARGVKEKLIRRHPHVFGDKQSHTEEEVVSNWDKIKKAEKGKSERKSALDGIPDTMPLLSKTQKMVKVFVKKRFLSLENKQPISENEVVDKLWDLLLQAEKAGIDLEGAFRRKVSEEKKEYLDWESAT